MLVSCCREAVRVVRFVGDARVSAVRVVPVIRCVLR